MSEPSLSNSKNIPLAKKPDAIKPQLGFKLGNMMLDIESLKDFNKRKYKFLSSFQAKNIPLKVHSKYIKKTLDLARGNKLRTSLSTKFLLDRYGERDFILPCRSQVSYFYISDLTLYCMENDEKTLNLLFKSLKLFRGLTCLHIEFFDQTELNQNLNKLIQSFKYLQNLTKLSVSFVSCTGIDPINIERFYRGIKILQSLNSLTLGYASMNRVGYSEIKTLFSSLNQMKNLTSLELNLPKYLANEEKNFESVLTSLGQLENLINLDLFFSSHPIQNNQLIGTLTENIKKMKNLKALQLSFSGHSVKDDEINEMSLGLKELSDLRNFSLKFDSCFNVSDEAISDLGQRIKEMKRLKKLTLHFNHSLNISDIGIQKAFRELKMLKELANINLNFDYAIVVRRFKSLEELLDLDEEEPFESDEEIQETPENKKKCNIF